LDAENWYSVKARQIKDAGGYFMAYFYYGGFGKALAKIYPEVKFDLKRLQDKSTFSST